MAATIIVLPEMTVFVKMTGSRGAVLKNRDQFEALCESLKAELILKSYIRKPDISGKHISRSDIRF